jgi:hypothetical protein
MEQFGHALPCTAQIARRAYAVPPQETARWRLPSPVVLSPARQNYSGDFGTPEALGIDPNTPYARRTVVTPALHVRAIFRHGRP